MDAVIIRRPSVLVVGIVLTKTGEDMESLSSPDLLKNLTRATLLGEQIAQFSLDMPLDVLEYPPSNLFSPVFQQNLLGLITDEADLDIVFEVNLYLQRNFEAVLPWLDQQIVHGNPELDTQHPWQEVCLFDELLLIGAFGRDDVSVLTSDWVKEFLRASTATKPISLLTAENAFSVLLCTRLHQLQEWLRTGDKTQTNWEKAYMTSLLGMAQDISSAWQDVWTIKSQGREVADVVVPPVIQAWVANYSIDQIAGLPVEEWALVMIALGKATRLSEMIRLIDKLVDDWFQGELTAPLSVLTDMMVNLSVALTRNDQQAALYRLRAMIGWMQEEAPKDESILEAQAYIQQNLAAMLCEYER